jgi:CrcB protein
MRDNDTEQVVDGKARLPLDPDLDPTEDQAAHPRPEPAPDQAEHLPMDPDAPDEPLFAPGRRAHTLPPWRVLAVIALGGFFGGLSRYGLGLAFPTHHGAFPAATFAINVSGSFILALLIVFVLEVWPPTTYIRPLIGVGFCGAYTTFSTWMVGVDQLISDGKSATALWYLLGSLVAGLGATSLGLTTGRAVVAHRHRARETRATGVTRATGATSPSREPAETRTSQRLETAEEGQA